MSSKQIQSSVEKCLNDTLVLSKLNDCVYELFLKDMQHQRERVNNYGKERWL